MHSKIGFAETPIEIANLMVDLSNASLNASVLDTGCGKGVFLQALKNKGYNNVYGVEINKELYSYCAEKFGQHFKIMLADFLNFPFDQQFDLIIGNPPYVHFNKLPPSIASNVKTITKTSQGDIYYAFIIKAISLLKDGGELIYIVPYHFFYNTYAKCVRETLLQNGKIEVIIDLDETRIFYNENPETIIFKFKKGKYNLNNEKIILLNIKTTKTNSAEIYNKAIMSLQEKTSNDIFDYKEIPHYTNTNQWSTHIQNISIPTSHTLKTVAKVGVGLVSGYDEAFIVNKDINFNSNELSLIKKFVKGKHCKRFIVDDYETYIVIDTSIQNEHELKLTYPNIYQHILPFKEQMSSRYLPNKAEWFHWQALRNYQFLLSNLNKQRIYVPTLDRHPYNRFSLGDKGLLPSGDVLFIQPYNEQDLYFLLGYLNTTFFRQYYLSKGGRRGRRISFTQKLLENIEIPFFTEDTKQEIIIIVQHIVSNLKENKNISSLEQQLDSLVSSVIQQSDYDQIYFKAKQL